jgi:hypothetical protein
MSQIILEKLVNKSVNTVKVEREFLSHNLIHAQTQIFVEFLTGCL